MNERMEHAVDCAARALAEHEGTEGVFLVEGNNPVAKQAANTYREQARIAIGAFAVSIQDRGA